MGTYLITGASGGIGAATAALLHRRGHELTLAGRDPRRVAAATARLPGSRPLLVDLADHAAIAPAVAALARTRLDGLIHCAGTVELGTVADTPAAVWATTLAVNVVAAAELTRALLPALRAARGHVVFVNSTAMLHAAPGWGAYAASKAGLRALADALRAEEPAVRVTSVFPGRTATEMQRKVHAQEGRPYDPTRFVAPDTVAAAIVTALETPPDAELTELTVRPVRR